MATGTISSLGVGSGLQLQDILDQLKAVDEQAITTKKNAVTTAQAQLQEFSVVNGKLFDMKSPALDLTLSSTYLGRTVSTGNEDALTATVTDGATVQSKSVTVNRLATKSLWQSTSGMSGEDAVLGTVDTTIGYQLGDTAVTVDVPAGTTLGELVDLINNDSNNPGVVASVINTGDDSNPYHLVLESAGTGEDNRISNISNLVMTEVQGNGTSLDASFAIDGITYTRQSNTVSDVISGVTMNLQGEGTSSLTVSGDDSKITDLITKLVTAYNDAVQQVRTDTDYNSDTGEWGTLARTSVRSIPYDLQNVMTGSAYGDSTGTITSLFDLGMQFNRDGTITLDADTLAAAIADHPDAVQAFFVGDEDAGITGFADTVNEQLRSMTGDTGPVETEATATQDRIDSLNKQIEADTDRLNKKYDMLTQQFVKLDQYMSQMTSMSDYLTSQFASFSDTSSSSSSSS